MADLAIEAGHSIDSSLRIQISADLQEINKYPAKHHAEKVASQLQAQEALIYLPGQRSRLLPDSDQGEPFRQLRYFYYMSGVDEADCHVIYDIKRRLLTLYIPRVTPQGAIWLGQDLTIKEARRRYDVDEVKHVDQLLPDIDGFANRHRDTDSTPIVFALHEWYSPPPSDNSRYKIDNSTRLRYAMDVCRVIKDAHEISLIRKANQISTKAHTAVLQNIHHFKNETEIEAIFEETCISLGAKNQAYGIIAASGPNASVLHYMHNNEPLKGRQLVCLDAGAEVDCYASDVTRTFPLSGRGHWPTPEAEQIYNLVDRMQTSCIKLIRPGVRFLSLHLLAHGIAVGGLMRLGILRGGTPEEIYLSGASRIFFPHGLGHHMGLEVHDVAARPLLGVADAKPHPLVDTSLCHAPCSEDSPVLEAGMVVTVEPGIYFSRTALEQLVTPQMERFIDLELARRYIPVGGVRIEDDILVKKDGYENLTTAPKGEEMLRVIREGNKRGC